MPAIDPYGGFARNPYGCADHAKAVTPSDTADLEVVAAALIGTIGNYRVTTVSGETLTIYAPNGHLPVRVSRVWATGTTGTNITALW